MKLNFVSISMYKNRNPVFQVVGSFTVSYQQSYRRGIACRIFYCYWDTGRLETRWGTRFDEKRKCHAYVSRLYLRRMGVKWMKYRVNC